MEDTSRYRTSAVFDVMLRDGLRARTNNFLSQYKLTTEKVRKTCIWPGGDKSSWIIDKSSRIMWIGVHGANSICVVTRRSDEDMIHVRGGICVGGVAKTGLTLIRQAVICEIQELAESGAGSALRGKKAEKPFGVVSVIQRTDKARKEREHELKYLEIIKQSIVMMEAPTAANDRIASISRWEVREDLYSEITEAIYQITKKDELHEKEAINFLQAKLRRKIPFTVNETIQTAISAFQHLFEKVFKADDIEVSVIDPEYGPTFEELIHKDAYVKELEKSEIEEHLAVINVPGTINKVSPPENCLSNKQNEVEDMDTFFRHKKEQRALKKGAKPLGLAQALKKKNIKNEQC